MTLLRQMQTERFSMALVIDELTIKNTELMDANRNIFVDEKNDKFYVTDFSLMTDRMIVYDIKTGHYNNIQIMHKGREIGIRDIIVRNDSIMYITTMQLRGGKSDCPLFCQTTSGKLLWEIKKIHPKEQGKNVWK